MKKTLLAAAIMGAVGLTSISTSASAGGSYKNWNTEWFSSFTAWLIVIRARNVAWGQQYEMYTKLYTNNWGLDYYDTGEAAIWSNYGMNLAFGLGGRTPFTVGYGCLVVEPNNDATTTTECRGRVKGDPRVASWFPQGAMQEIKIKLSLQADTHGGTAAGAQYVSICLENADPSNPGHAVLFDYIERYTGRTNISVSTVTDGQCDHQGIPASGVVSFFD